MTTLFLRNSVDGEFIMGNVDENGNPIKRTPEEHPYSYDSFVLWGDISGKKYPTSNCVYSDRMRQWDFDRYEIISKKHFGREVGYWGDIDPEKIETFLKDLLDCPNLKLYRLMQGCNHAFGNPIWMFFYHTEE